MVLMYQLAEAGSHSCWQRILNTTGPPPHFLSPFYLVLTFMVLMYQLAEVGSHSSWQRILPAPLPTSSLLTLWFWPSWSWCTSWRKLASSPAGREYYLPPSPLPLSFLSGSDLHGPDVPAGGSRLPIQLAENTTCPPPHFHSHFSLVLTFMVLMYQLAEVGSHSNWKVSKSEISSWLAVTSTPQQ